MNVLLTYDVSGKQFEVKQEMKKKGYMESWTDTSTKVEYYLPETTLWKNEFELKDAISDLQAVCKNLNIELVRAVAVPSFPYSAIPGKKF